MKKKLLVAVIAMASLLSLTACGEPVSENDIAKWNPDKYITSMCDYKNMTLEAEKAVITDEDIDAAIEDLRQNSKYFEEVTGRTLKMGDTANIDFVGKKDGVAFEGGSSEGFDLGIGSNQFIPGFEEALVGMSIGETKDIELSFPDEYPNEELAGKPATFTVTLNAIKEKKTPELDDKFASETGFEGVSNLAELKTFAREKLELNAQQNYESQLNNSAMSQIIELCEFTEEIPQERYKYYYDAIIQSDTAMASQYQVDLETFVVVYYGMQTYDDYIKYVEDSALKGVKVDLATSKILKNEKIKITDKVIKKEIEDNLEEYGCKSYEEFAAQYDLDEFKSYMVNQKAIDIIIENAQIVAPAPAEDDANTEE